MSLDRSVVEKWRSLIVRPDTIVSGRINTFDLAKQWISIGKSLAKMNPYHGEHGLFASGPGGGGASAYGSKDKSWRDMNDKGEKVTRYKQLLSELHATASDFLNPRQEWAEQKIARLNELKVNHEQSITDDDRKKAWQALMQSVGDIHDNERRKEQAKPLTEAERLERAGDKLLQDVGRGAGDNLSAQQNAQRVAEERAAAQRRADEARRSQQSGQSTYTQADREAVEREVARVKAAREATDFEERFNRATNSVSSEDRSILGPLGNAMGHAARSTYYAQELIRGLVGGAASVSSGNYLEAGRALMAARSDITSLRAGLGGLSEEGAKVVSRSLNVIRSAIVAARATTAKINES